MGKIVAIGGGEIAKLETEALNKEIIRLTGKKHPKLLLIPTARNDAEGYWKTIQAVFGRRHGCKTSVLYLLKENPSKYEIRNKILSSDAIYVGGGDTLRMLKRWKKLGITNIFREAHRKGVVLSGISAGAICWFRYGTSDFRRVKNPKAPLSRISGLDFIHATFSPHHIRERDRTPALKRIMKKTSGIGLALDDNAAIEIVDDQYRIITSRQHSKVHKVYYSRGKLHYEEIPKTKSFSPLKELLKKN